VPTGNHDFTQENVFNGSIPSRMVICMVDNDAFNGSYEKNPFNFKTYGLTSLKLLLDGNQQQSVKPIELDFDEHRFIEAYMSLFSGTGKQLKDEGTDIDRTDFPKGYAIYAFDLTPDMNEDGHFNLMREGSVRLDLKFKTALPNTINVLVYSEFEHVIELNRNRDVIFDFTT